MFSAKTCLDAWVLLDIPFASHYNITLVYSGAEKSAPIKR